MSAGHSLRRGGYAYGLSTAVHSGPTLGKRASADVLSLIVMATLVFVIVAVASDPVLAASAGKIIGAAWADMLGLLTSLVSRSG